MDALVSWVADRTSGGGAEPVRVAAQQAAG
jgi:hypothetical protein